MRHAIRSPLALALACAVSGCGGAVVVDDHEISDDELGALEQPLGAPASVGAMPCSSPFAVSYDGAGAYFTWLATTGCASGRVQKMSLASGARTSLVSSGPSSAAESRSDGANLFFVEWSADDVRRVSVGGGVNNFQADTSGAIYHRGIAVDATSVYWADQLGIRKQPKAGGAVATLFADAGCRLLGVDGLHVYYQRLPFASSTRELRRVPLGGGASSVLATQPRDFSHLVMDGNFLYFADNPDTGTRLLRRIGKSGGTVTTLRSTNFHIAGIAVNPSNIYWAETESSDVRAKGNVLRRSNPGGDGTTTTQLVGRTGPHALHLSSTHLFWVEGASSNVLVKATLP